MLRLVFVPLVVFAVVVQSAETPKVKINKVYRGSAVYCKEQAKAQDCFVKPDVVACIMDGYYAEVCQNKTIEDSYENMKDILNKCLGTSQKMAALSKADSLNKCLKNAGSSENIAIDKLSKAYVAATKPFYKEMQKAGLDQVKKGNKCPSEATLAAIYSAGVKKINKKYTNKIFNDLSNRFTCPEVQCFKDNIGSMMNVAALVDKMTTGTKKNCQFQ